MHGNKSKVTITVICLLGLYRLYFAFELVLKDESV